LLIVLGFSKSFELFFHLKKQISLVKEIYFLLFKFSVKIILNFLVLKWLTCFKLISPFFLTQLWSSRPARLLDWRHIKFLTWLGRCVPFPFGWSLVKILSLDRLHFILCEIWRLRSRDSRLWFLPVHFLLKLSLLSFEHFWSDSFTDFRFKWKFFIWSTFWRQLCFSINIFLHTSRHWGRCEWLLCEGAHSFLTGDFLFYAFFFVN
jgi:hypothetical protein